MSRKDFSQQFPSHRDFSQQFPTHRDFSQQFPNEHDFSQQFPSSNLIPNEPVNTPPEDIFPVFTPENEPVNNPPVVEHQPNPFGLTEDELRLLEQDEEVRRETEQRELQEEAARMEQEARDAEHLRKNSFNIMEGKYYDGKFRESSSEEGWNSDFSL